jgi:hypothetical protein
MGSSLSWLAFRGPSSTGGLVQLGLTDTGEKTDYYSTAISGIALSNGWHLVVAKGCDHRLISERTLRQLSSELEVVGCSVEEHVMFASAEFWKSGTLVWRIEHSSERSPRDLKTFGNMPECFQEEVNRATKLQDAVDLTGDETDYFIEVPLEVANLLTGFKYDGDSGLEDDAFHKYASSRTWWQFWR